MPYNYYKESLSGERLRRVYEIAPARVRRYLEAETDHVVQKTDRGSSMLELGCGYGRILPRLAAKAGVVVGIDTSLDSLLLARRELTQVASCLLVSMDATCMGFEDGRFDGVACIQNGISAFHADQKQLIREALRVARHGGLVLFSTYAERFWDDRLEWFELQAEEGLLGPIDYERTGGGVIVCKDGFTATTVTPEGFRLLTRDLGGEVEIVEVDGSSLFCEIRVP
jgi:SAM-dependent methyltransferase